MTNTHTAEGNEVKSVATNLELIEMLRKLDGATVTELSSRLDISKSSVHAHLQTLTNRGYATADDGEYRIGLRYLTLGGHAQSKPRLYRLARPEIDGLVDQTRLKATVMVEEHGRGIYLYQRRHEDAIQTDSHAGTRVYLHCTGLGKAILSRLDRERVEEIVERHGLPTLTDRTVTSETELFEELDQIREQGYAIDDQERIDGIRCVAAPIVTDSGDVLGSLSVSGSTKNFPEERIDELSSAVQEAARVIEINYMYTD